MDWETLDRLADFDLIMIIMVGTFLSSISMQDKLSRASKRGLLSDQV